MTLIAAGCITFFMAVHLVLELIFKQFNTTWQSKPREAQIEYREYCVSILHSCIVCPLSYYGMFEVW